MSKSKQPIAAELPDQLLSDEVTAWQSRPLAPIHPIVYPACSHTKVRDGVVRLNAVHLARGIKLADKTEILGLWIARNGGDKF